MLFDRFIEKRSGEIIIQGPQVEIESYNTLIPLIQNQLREGDIEDKIRRYHSNVYQYRIHRGDEDKVCKNAAYDDKAHKLLTSLLNSIEQLSIDGFLRLAVNCQQV